jgi:hypothetical protein
VEQLVSITAARQRLAALGQADELVMRMDVDQAV